MKITNLITVMLSLAAFTWMIPSESTGSEKNHELSEKKIKEEISNSKNRNSGRTFGVYCWEKAVIKSGITNSNAAWQTMKTAVDDPGMKLGGVLIQDVGGILSNDYPSCTNSDTTNYQDMTDFILALDGKGTQGTTSGKMTVSFMYGWTPGSGGSIQDVYDNAPNIIDRVTDYLDSAQGNALKQGADQLSYSTIQVQLAVEPQDCFCSANGYIRMLENAREKVDDWNNSSAMGMTLELSVYTNNVTGLVGFSPPAGCNSQTCSYVTDLTQTMAYKIMDYVDSLTFAAARTLACYDEMGKYLDPQTCETCQLDLPGAVDGIAPWARHFARISAEKLSNDGRDVPISFHVSTRPTTSSSCCKRTFGNCSQSTVSESDPTSMLNVLETSRDAISSWGFDQNFAKGITGVTPAYDGVIIHDFSGWYTLYNYNKTQTYLHAPGWTSFPLDACTVTACDNVPCSSFPPGSGAIVCPGSAPCPTTITECHGDFNEDGTIDGMDLGIILGCFGSSKSNCDMDINGLVNAEDITLFLSNWGDCHSD